MGPPGVSGIWGEWLFIFRELGSTGSLGSKLIVFGDLRSPAKKGKNLTLKKSLHFVLFFFKYSATGGGESPQTRLQKSKCIYFRAFMLIWIGIGD